MRRNEFEPLIDKIRRKFTSWTHRCLSYGGRLQLIKAVIASITNFWQSVFRLPQRCLDIIESLCSSFLWTGTITKSSGIKVAWKEITSTKSEGGLGLRSFRETSIVYSLNLIWKLFDNSSSLWVSWVQVYLLRESSFWDISVTSTKGSWIWRKLLKLRDLASQFIRVEVKNGLTASFWHDNWLGSGKLWDQNSPYQTRDLGIQRNAKVADAGTTNGWIIRKSRYISNRSIYDKIHTHHLPTSDGAADIYLWRQDETTYKNRFISSVTWKQIRQVGSEVSWASLVWFPYSVPRQSFIQLLAFKNRLSTGDRMRNWGIIKGCVFCGERNETVEHLFFGCPYSFQVWILLVREIMGRRTDPDWTQTIMGIIHFKRSKVDYTILRLAFQTTIYAIWRERNARSHGKQPKHFRTLAFSISKLITERISSKPSDTELKVRLETRWLSCWNSGNSL